MAGATGTAAVPGKRETSALKTLHGVIMLCLFALLMLTGDAADNIGRTPQLKTKYHVPYLREVAITLPIFTAISLIFVCAILPRVHYDPPQNPPNPRKEMEWFAIAGIGQLIIAGLLITLTALQATFLPRPLGQCKNLRQLGEISYLDVIAKAIMSHYAKSKGRGSVCAKMVQNWRFQIANIILLGTAGLFCLLHAARKSRSETDARIRFENRLKERGIGMPITSSIDTVQGCEDVEMGLAPKLSYSHDKDLARTSITQIDSTFLSVPLPRSCEHYLQRALSAYDLLSTIAAECHYHDMWNLMLVSRGIRSAIFGTTTQRRLWKKSLCSHSTNQHSQNELYPSNTSAADGLPVMLIRCFACGSPMCKDCENKSEPFQAETIRHLRDCRPCCGVCFRAKHCFLSRGGKGDIDPGTMLPGKCDCGLGHLDPEPQPTEDMPTLTFGNSRTICYARSASRGDPTVSPVEVCKVCKGKTDTEMLSMRGYGAGNRVRTAIQTERSFLPDLKRVPGFKCHHCEREFRRGELVWWACDWCGKECLEGFHSQMGETIAP
ncbi:hypothetical protein BGX38DRAFT_363738 [Terfezia claveryi]|nr:hypothetical protein BGX38DRAFT_363738 [Terfezia claveryi]